MSWLAQNYDKAALGGGAICALALAYFGWSALNSVESDFVNNTRGSGKNETAVASADRVAKAIASLRIDRQWETKRHDDRKVDLFVSVPLFVSAQNPGQPIDLLKDDPVHPPIPNTWWIENRIDPGFEDSPERDPDADGFSNEEEFVATTDPNNAKSHPPLIAKLKYVGQETLIWAIRPSFPDGDGNTFRYLDSERRENKTGATNPIDDGGTFFENEPAAGRFKFLGHETREVFNDRINANERKTFARIEDQRPNKAGTIYEFPAPLSEAGVQEFQQYDRTAVFTLEAIGRGGQEFRVEEFTTFTLPPGGEGPAGHKVLDVTDEEVVVEFTNADGIKQTVTITKGTMPRM